MVLLDIRKDEGVYLAKKLLCWSIKMHKVVSVVSACFEYGTGNIVTYLPGTGGYVEIGMVLSTLGRPNLLVAAAKYLKDIELA